MGMQMRTGYPHVISIGTRGAARRSAVSKLHGSIGSELAEKADVEEGPPEPQIPKRWVRVEGVLQQQPGRHLHKGQLGPQAGAH